MQKIISQLLTLVVFLGLCSCSSGPVNQDLKSSSEIPISATATTPLVIQGETAKTDEDNDTESNAELPHLHSGRGQNPTIIFQWPVDSARLSRGFLPRARKPHLGIDLAAPKNTPIFAAHRGTVIYAGRGFKGYGKMVMLENDGGFATIYAHLSKILVKEGQTLIKGKQLGLMGRTGHATGNHLHFELRTAKGPVDPLPLLPKLQAQYVLGTKGPQQ